MGGREVNLPDLGNKARNVARSLTPGSLYWGFSPKLNAATPGRTWLGVISEDLEDPLERPDEWRGREVAATPLTPLVSVFQLGWWGALQSNSR